MADRNLKLSVIFDGLDRITGPLKDIMGGAGQTRKALSETRAELKALGAAQREIDKFKAGEAKLGIRSGELDQARTRLEALKAEMDAMERPTKKLAASFAAAERNVAKLTDQHDAAGRELQELSAKLGKAGIDVAQLGQHEDRLALRTHEATKELQDQKRALDQVAKSHRQADEMRDLSGKLAVSGAGMVATGIAAGAPVVGSIKEAMSFESAMADVRKVVDFDAPGSFEKMSSDLLDLSTRIPMAAEGLAQIAAEAGAAGVERNELLEFTEDAAKMGVAFGITAEEAGSTMAKWRAAFGAGQDEVVGLADRVNALTNAFGGQPDAVSAVITRIGPLGAAAGVAAPQIAAMGHLLNSVGIEAEVAATGIKNTMLALTKGGAATKSQQKAFASLGLDAEKLAASMQADAGGTILDVMQRIANLPKEMQAGTLTQIFGSESVSAIAPMLTKLDRLRENFKIVGDESQYAGSMTAEFLKRIATTEGATGLATNALNAVNIEMGTALLPTVTTLANEVRDFAGGFRDWAKEHPIITKGIGMFLGVGAALLVLLGGLSLAMAALTAAAAPLPIALGPLLLIIAAIAAVAAAAYLLYNNWGAIADWFGGIWESIKGTVAGAVDWFKKLDFLSIGRDMVRGLINGITSMLGQLKNTIVNAASNATKWFKEKLGIHSPSRVFAELGGFTMEGLNDGIAAGQSDPIERIQSVAKSMTKALALGAAVPAVAATPSTVPRHSDALPPAITNTYHITVQATGGDPDAIARAVRQAMEQAERDKAARRRSSYSDD